MSGRLVICPTPIGNLDDITLRVLAALRAADVVACEDTRRTRLLLERHGLEARLVSHHEHNEASRSPELVERIRAGETVALVSDAGTPLVSDPGFVLVRRCVEAGLAVEALPGPSAALVAVVASGLPADRWCFVGFLPRKAGDLRRLLRGVETTVVAFESPRRLGTSLAVLAEVGPERRVAVARELTKVHEEIVRGTAAELAARYADEKVRGEVVVVVGADEVGAAEGGPPAGLGALVRLVQGGARPRLAAGVVAELTGGNANRLYAALTEAGAADPHRDTDAKEGRPDR